MSLVYLRSMMLLDNIIIERKYLDQILKGEKPEEYRSFNNFYIEKLCVINDDKEIVDIKPFTHVKLCAGYRADRKYAVIELKGIFIDTFENFIPEGFQKGDQCFTFELGNVIETNV